MHEFKKQNKYNYYSKTQPEKQEIIIVKLKQITETGVYGESINYPHYTIFLVGTEISRKKKNLQNYLSPDILYPVFVLNVNEDLKIIDVSYMKINEEDKKKSLEIHKINELIYNLGYDYISFMDKNDKELNEKMFNDFTHKYTKRITLDLLIEKKNIDMNLNEYYDFLINPNKFIDIIDYDKVNQDRNENYLQDIKKRTTIIECVIECEFTLIALKNNGVEIIKKVLTDEIKFDNCVIEYVSSPKYKIVVTSQLNENEKDVINKLDMIIKTIETNNEKYKCLYENKKDYKKIRNKSYHLTYNNSSNNNTNSSNNNLNN